MVKTEETQYILTQLCKLIDRNDDLTMQVDYFEYKNMSKLEFVKAILNEITKSDEITKSNEEQYRFTEFHSMDDMFRLNRE